MGFEDAVRYAVIQRTIVISRTFPGKTPTGAPNPATMSANKTRGSSPNSAEREGSLWSRIFIATTSGSAMIKTRQIYQ